MSVKLLALAASTRTHSFNRRLVELAAAEARALGATVTVLDYAACDAPIYHGEHTGPLPSAAASLSAAIAAHDGWLLASPEYNWSIPGGLKNLIDWLSVDASAPLKGRTGLLMCASPSTRGGISGLQHLQVPLEVLGMWVYPQLIGIGDAANQIGTDRLVRDKDQHYLVECVTDFVRATKALRHA